MAIFVTCSLISEVAVHVNNVGENVTACVLGFDSFTLSPLAPEERNPNSSWKLDHMPYVTIPSEIFVVFRAQRCISPLYHQNTIYIGLRALAICKRESGLVAGYIFFEVTFKLHCCKFNTILARSYLLQLQLREDSSFSFL